MNQHGAERIGELLEQTLAMTAPQRCRFLGALRDEDADVARDLDSLLAAYEEAPDGLDALAARVLPPALDGLSHALDAQAPLRERNLGRYEILERLGGGGMGEVYRARDPELDRLVAIKLLPAHLTADPEARARLKREARAASALDHPNIAVVHEIGATEPAPVDREPERLFMVMVYYAGETLKQKIARGLVPIADALDYAIQVAEGLVAAHEAGIVHRDIKPANLMVTELGQVKIVDFGLAKLAGTELIEEGTARGTLAYMSPEQTRGGPLDARTDVWSLGVVLYEMLAVERPFRGENDRSLIHAVRHNEPEPVDATRPEVPTALAAIIRTCLEKNPEDRYSGAQDLLQDLRAVAMDRAVAPRARTTWRKQGSLLIGGVALLLGLLVAGGLALFDSPPPAERALAVLPVANLSGDDEQDAFTDGMTELMINQLSGVSGLNRVVPLTSVMPYRGTQKPLREIGRELGADLLVEASALRAGERVRFHVSVIEAATEQSLWSDSFERRLSDVLALQRDVVLAIAREVAGALTAEEVVRLTQAVPEVDADALAFYLEASRGRISGVDDAQRRIAYLKQAVALDSTFAAAHAALAALYAVRFNDFGRAEEAVERALRLNPDLPSAYVTLSLIRQWAHSDWAGAEAALRRALEVAPLDAKAHHELAILLKRVGRFEEALAHSRRALYLDPRSSAYQEGLGEVYLHGGRYTEAIREFEHALRIDPAQVRTTWFLGEAYFLQGQYDEAVRWYEQGWGVPPSAYAALGRRAEALAVLDSLLARVERGELVTNRNLAGNLALLYTSLGEYDQALDWLELAVDQRLGWIPVDLKVTPRLAPLHSHPRYRALLKQVSLSP